MNKYVEYLKSKTSAKISLALLFAVIAVAVYVLVKISGYFTSPLGMVIAGLAVSAAVLWLLHLKFPKVAIVLEILCIALLCTVMVPVETVDNVVEEVIQTVEYETVQIAVLKESTLDSDSDLSACVMGYLNEDDGSYERASEILEEHNKVVKSAKPYKTMESLYDALLNGKIQLLVLTPTAKMDLEQIDEDYIDKIRILFDKQYVLGEIKSKHVDISKEPFTLYLCGADLSSGENINSTGRGDVNILLTVNPETEQVYLQVVPRDTFVYIPCRGGSSKLSYSGWWGGVQSSIESIEEKFDIEINYYAKINFAGLKDLVNALGGVNVYSHYTFSNGSRYTFYKGYNYVDGDMALSFARCRKMLPENELSRGQHQMELIKGIFNKFAENPTYDNSMAVLDAMSTNFVTNLPKESYYDAFSLVVKLLPELTQMENHSIEGEYQWHYDEIRAGYYQYYYYPEQSEIDRVHDTIEAVKAGKEVDHE